MADNEEGEEHNPRGNEWEVVSLTASAYAAAPGPREIELKDDNEVETHGDDAETSRALFMSGHFVFPPTEHENLPLEPMLPEESEIHTEHVGKDAVSEFGEQEGGRCSRKDEGDWTLKDLNVPDELAGLKVFDEKGNRLPFHGTHFDEGTALQGLNFIDKEQSLYSEATFSSFHSEAVLGGSVPYGDEPVSDLTETSEQGVGFPQETPLSPKPTQGDKETSSDLPCEAWWKRRAVSLYSHAKEANAFWSVFIAAAVMGLVILGQRWQQERWQVLQLKWHHSVNSENTGRLMGPISRLKDVIVGGSHRRGSFVRGSSASDI